MAVIETTQEDDDLRWLMGLTVDELDAVLSEMSPLDREELLHRVDALAPPPEPWTPLPHQVPPSLDDNWYGWLLLGGRGSGKTAAVTHMMDDHANGPPCFATGPVPHRMGIIAPTLGDASSSIVHGDDGLAVINPDVKEVTRKGGTVVLWPNGAMAHLFGVHTKNDVDRLRAGGNRSLLVGTPIETEHGPRRIETVQPGDRVWTEHGLRPVLASTGHGMRPIWRVQTRAGRWLSLTPDHELWVQGQGWTRTDRLVAGSRLTAWNGTVTAGNGSAHTGAGRSSAGTRTVLGPAPRSCSTEPSTSTTTEPSPKDGMSTTTTRTRATTIRTTSWRSPRRIMRPSTHSRPTGTRPEDGQRRRVDAFFVPTAPNADDRVHEPTPSSVRSGVGAIISGSMRPPEECGHVSCAAAILSAPPTAPPSLADDVVEMILPGSVVGPVWDLTVAGAHDFFADGILAHNCFDLREEVAAWRYLKDGMDQADLGLRRGLARWIGATTPRARHTIRKLNASPIVKVSTATTNDNPHLNEVDRERLYEQFGNTTVGQQELEGLIIDEVDGALWTQELIDQYRVSPEEVPKLLRVRTYVDPSWGTKNDECGIVVCGIDKRRHVYVLADLSKRTTPEEWAMIAAIGRLPGKVVGPDGVKHWIPEQLEPRLWHGRVSERVVAEKNFQGEQVKMAMKLASRELDRRIIFGWVNSSQGKRLRAEPVHLYSEQGKVHFVGHHPGLEFQLTSWVPPEAGEDGGDPGDPEMDETTGEPGQESSKWSPDRLDAFVFGVTDLALGASAGTGHMEVADGRVPRQEVPDAPRGPSKPAVGRIPQSSRQAAMVRRQLQRPPAAE